MNLNVPGDNPTDQDYADLMRYYRDRFLAESDWTQLPDVEVDVDAWKTYRQQLRDFPSTWTPGPTADFPAPPT